ncbi:hypothetical protein FHS83_000402 [Rhizomicrobium palustre]|uniref:Uncharacterized protein n=1 Tax=Rhizomicrobium palustre TaxID=189966 RepID=A0A846MUH4_9PROT|nr:hypothetical protein [Rhizomicrobium palustre]NIK87084.1 hypothetical protein [Rhizomicrobium palustre]
MAELTARIHAADASAHRARRRSFAIGAVICLHILFVWLLILAQYGVLEVVPKPKLERLTWLNLELPSQAPKVLPAPKKDQKSDSAVNPLLVPKIIRPKEEENNAITDLGLALGRSLACGANSFEYLNSKMRSECKHKPWQFVYDRYGNIILDPQGRTPQEREETLRPSDVQAKERNTAPRCPQNIDPNAPCVADIIGGRR